MEQTFIIAVVAGLLGTLVMTTMMLLGRQMNLPAVDAHGVLGHVLSAEKANPLGYIMHGLMGVVFAVGYIVVFQMIPANIVLLGAILGVVHWLVVGWMFAFAPLIHAGMKAGTVEITGAYMLKSLGFVGFIAGTIGHIAFGITVAVVYIAMNGAVAV